MEREEDEHRGDGEKGLQEVVVVGRLKTRLNITCNVTALHLASDNHKSCERELHQERSSYIGGERKMVSADSNAISNREKC